MRHRDVHDAPDRCLDRPAAGGDGFVAVMNDAGRQHVYPLRGRFELNEASRRLATLGLASSSMNQSVDGFAEAHLVEFPSIV
jgi:hypothetical protein